MARQRTGAELLSDLALRADVGAFSSSTRPTTTQAYDLLTRSLYRFSHKHNAFGTRFKTDTIAVSSGTTSYSLPTDFAALEYFRYTDGGVRHKVRAGSVDDIDREDTDTLGWSAGHAVYNLRGRNVIFNDPKASYTVTIGYVPELEAYDSGDNAIAGLTTSDDYILAEGGIDDWIVLDAAVAILGIEERDPTALLVEKQMIEEDLQRHLAERDLHEPIAVRNTWDKRNRSRWGD